jgi:hypothetical protein
MGTASVPFGGIFPATVKLAPNGTSFGAVSLGVTPRPVARCICTAADNLAPNLTTANAD